MAKLSIVAGATSQSANVFIQDSSSTVGAGLAGLVFNTSGLIAYYTFTGANATATAITLATLAAVNSAFSSGGFKELDATNMKGLYRFDIPNAALATSKGRCVTLMLSGATNMAPLALEIELTGWDNQDGVHGGLTCLPNTAVTTNASLLTSGTGTDQLSVTSGRIDVGKLLGTAWLTPGTAGTPDVNAKLIGGTAQTGRDIGASVLLASGQKVDVDTIKTNPVVNAGTVTFPTGATLASTANITAGTITTVTNLTNAPTAGDLTAAMKTSVTTAATAATPIAASVTGAVGSVIAAVTLPSIPANWITAAGIADASIDRATFAADTGLQNIRANTAQAGAATTITLDGSASATNSFYNNDLIYLTGGTGAGQSRFITAYVGATKVATVATWAINPDNTTTFAILPFDAVAGATAPTVAQIATGVWQDTTGGDFTVASSIGKSVMNGVALGTGLTINDITTKTGYSLTQTFPTNFSALGISAGGHVSNVDTLTTYTGNTVQTGDGFARLGAPAGASVSADVAAVKTDTAAVKVQTDKLAFTSANKVDANVLSVNSHGVTGDGHAGTEWGPA